MLSWRDSSWPWPSPRSRARREAPPPPRTAVTPSRLVSGLIDDSSAFIRRLLGRHRRLLGLHSAPLLGMSAQGYCWRWCVQGSPQSSAVSSHTSARSGSSNVSTQSSSFLSNSLRVVRAQMACAQVDVDLKCKNIFQEHLYPFVTSIYISEVSNLNMER